MRRLFKFLAIGVGVLMLVIVVAVWLVVANLDRIIKETVETVGTDVAGTQVTLESAALSLRTAEGTLDGLTIANPSGFEAPSAFELERITIGIDPETVRTDVVVLREVVVEGAHLTFEQIGDHNNLQTILDHMESGEGSTAEAESTDVRLVIESFRFAGGDVTLLADQLGEPLTVPLSEVVLRDVGRRETGATVASVARQLLEPILRNTVDAAKGEARAQLEARARAEIEQQRDKALEELKDRLGKN